MRTGCPTRSISRATPSGATSRRSEAFEYWDFLGACYWLWDARMMAEMAAATGEKADEKAFRDTAETAPAHIRGKCDGGRVGCQRPSATCRRRAFFALKLGLLADAKAVAETKAILLQNIKEHGDCLQTGFLGTSILMNTLTYEAGAPDVAYTSAAGKTRTRAGSTPSIRERPRSGSAGTAM